MGEKLQPVDINDSRAVGRLVNALLETVDALNARVIELEKAATKPAEENHAEKAN